MYRMCKFRLSNLNILIEKGRNEKPKIDPSRRSCPFCPSQVEDEYHFLLKCPVYVHLRVRLFDEIKRIIPDFYYPPDKFFFSGIFWNVQTFLHAFLVLSIRLTVLGGFSCQSTKTCGRVPPTPIFTCKVWETDPLELKASTFNKHNVLTKSTQTSFSCDEQFFITLHLNVHTYSIHFLYVSLFIYLI